MSANAKCEFADLKYQQMLSDKYFVETCFSKKYDSYSPKDKLIDTLFFVKFEEKCPSYSESIECLK